MTPVRFLDEIIMPGLANLRALGGPRVTRDAARFLLAVAAQESMLIYRAQVLSGGRKGPARGLWQFERRGGVEGVLAHHASKALAKSLCVQQGVSATTSYAVWLRLESNDMLAVGFARLLLWTDPMPIPTDEADAWECYAKRLWRPGKPHPKTWPENWRNASEAVTNDNFS